MRKYQYKFLILSLISFWTLDSCANTPDDLSESSCVSPQSPKKNDIIQNFYEQSIEAFYSQNEKLGFELLEKEVDSNKDNAKALFDIAVCLEKGKGCKKDLDKAITYFEKACDLDYPDAFNNLGAIYEINKGDIDMALRHYFLSSYHGYRLGKENLERLKKENKEIFEKVLQEFNEL